MFDAERGGSFRDSCSARVGNGAAANKLESVGPLLNNRHGFPHIGFGFCQRQRIAIGALNDRPACGLVVELLDTGNISSLVTAGLTVPNEVMPAGAHVISEDKALKLDATVILEMNRMNRARHHHSDIVL